MDFFKPEVKVTKKSGYTMYDISPIFVVCHSKDLMVRGKSFYAVWNEETRLWSTDEYDIVPIVDTALRAKAQELKEEHPDSIINVKYLENYSTGSWDIFKRFLSKVSDNSKDLDSSITFANNETSKESYVSKKLDYALEDGDISAWEELVGTLSSPDEKQKIEWAIGSIVSGDAKSIQKFLVFYGDAGSGKSTVLNIIESLFDGYCVSFDAKALTSANSGFSTEPFKDNPLIAIQHDGDLSRIEDNSLLNSIVSHEKILVNEKHKNLYSIIPKCFLFMASNKPVKITDAKSGLIRRVIDVIPTGNRLSNSKYNRLMKTIIFERGPIAKHCLDIYKSLGKHYYDSYTPLSMMYNTDPFFNFVEENYLYFKEEDGVSLKQAYAMYKEYCTNSQVGFVLPMYKFREELKNYFKTFEVEARVNGTHIRSWFSGFMYEKFDEKKQESEKEEIDIPDWLKLEERSSLFDIYCSNCLAQYANKYETPNKEWANVKTTLSDLDTRKLHYVKPQENHIVIDFDISDDNGKNLELNLKAAADFPPTYAEVSKGGQGLHLHYIYNGDLDQLSNIYSEHIEIKVFKGGSALRRKLSLCNDIPISTISSGLPIRERKRMVNFEGIKSEKALRSLIIKNLNKEIAGHTKPSIELIFKDLENAYASGLNYDVSDLRPAIQNFALGSTNNGQYCFKLVGKMKFKSDDISEITQHQFAGDDSDIVFYDVEVFPNLLLINWKYRGEGKKVVRMINPSASEVEDLMKLKLVGFNCRRYDNHILYARMMGYSNEQLFDLSQRIINGSKNAMFGEAYNVSYTDIYDFSNTKQSLKKWEIELHIHHQELGLPWDQPVPEEMWVKVAEYCDNDVLATEAVFDYLHEDWVARKILAKLANGTVNDSTNSLTAKIIFGNDKTPQDQFVYRNLAEPCDDKPYFPGYSYDHGVSIYRDEEVGEGGYVYSEPGMYTNVALLDVESMHPTSAINEGIFGPIYTDRYAELKRTRIAVKHWDLDILNTAFNGTVKEIMDEFDISEENSGSLSYALKIPINAVYGMTSAKFENKFKDPRNVDNIVAKRGALFMIDLKHFVQEKGYTVAHIKTDSIKIPNADTNIIREVMNFGKKYGYTFEHEAMYDKMCLVNDAVYIAKYASDGKCMDTYGYIPSANTKHWKKHDHPWTATGAEFAVPFIFKTLFSHENIDFYDRTYTASVSTAMYLDFNENLPEGEHNYRFIGKSGQFCPIKDGNNAGILLRENKDKTKYDSVSGTKGYRWLEAEEVKILKLENLINDEYYISQCNKVIDHIKEFGDWEWLLDPDEVPWVPF
ncbi:MAG: hypothetical protein J6Y02_16290 [Pseudobutyrivibrio sp.]|nr:hypothetical protein [Pseudobutyrivibrio sp.]